MLAALFPGYRWGRMALLRVFRFRALVAGRWVLVPVVLQFCLDALNAGIVPALANLGRHRIEWFAQLLVPVLAIAHLGIHIEASQRLSLHYSIFGRRESAKLVRRLCFRLALHSALPIAAGALAAVMLVWLASGGRAELRSIFLVGLQLGILLVLAPTVLALAMDKRGRGAGVGRFRTMGGMALVGFAMYAVSSLVFFEPSVVAALVVLIVAGFFCGPAYLTWFYARRNLVRR